MTAVNLSKSTLSRMIDHTNLKPDANRDQIESLCRQAVEHRFASVCVNPTWVALCADILQGTPLPVCTVIGFPLGANTTAVKVAEAQDALSRGAREIDMVINIGLIKSGEPDLVRDEIRQIITAAPGALVKVILEMCWLSEEEKETACRLAQEAGAHFVKTSTGFGKGGATVSDIRLMHRMVGGRMGIKASGGIRALPAAIEMIAAGATRLGTSSGISLLKEIESEEKN